MNADDRSMIVLQWTPHEVSHLVHRYAYLENIHFQLLLTY